mmetsp:Transcript_1269/g.1621  ORF Transcript_1269/g.1621 Transcript_1269/m.1621 type:complete len:422 (+) Transcript_1269:47-1312(+)|eukprot:CAMPEP_0204823550 /NCGR_PEP_ID=MMETSP1346-20131115/1618_1 /ASSEMBLY_ACC=CAM_ASM_000771 /TAXON_ID=215587 /ORGANISM="Aplanochytrium stocchinoi, Strain GSBS06" /LENGTH=421 /DNA_ID=CAMNT_0051950233 /DNA_START=538 /DNA_END=1803 /DNA_ORIENTATION=+
MMDEDFKDLMNVFDDAVPNVSLLQEQDALFEQNQEDYMSNLKRRRSRFSGCFGTMGNDVKSVKEQHQLTTRLRRASEVHCSGILTTDEKDALKDKLLSRDPKFAAEFDKAQQTGNWDLLREKLNVPRSNTLNARRSSLLMALMERDEDEEVILGDDLSAVFDSTGLDLSGDDLKAGFLLRQGTDLSAVSKRNSLLAAAKDLLKKDMPKTGPKRHSLMMPEEQKKPSFVDNKKITSIPETPIKSTNERTMIETKNRETRPRGRGRPKGSTKGKGTNKARGSGKKCTSRKQTPATYKMGATGPTSSYYPPAPPGKKTGNVPFDLLDDPNDTHAKYRKNERERRRRLVVSQGFTELIRVLNLGESAKVDKATILNSSIKRISMLEKQIDALQAENQALKKTNTIKSIPVQAASLVKAANPVKAS